VREVAELIGPDRMFLNPDCGFGTFADRPVATPEIAFRKLCALSAAAERLRNS
jgi:5-methyltetrahydropteroyltriglutamate--homocysteine methyltransferase